MEAPPYSSSTNRSAPPEGSDNLRSIRSSSSSITQSSAVSLCKFCLFRFDFVPIATGPAGFSWIAERDLLLVGMPAMVFQGSSVPLASFGRSILSLRREQVHSVDGQQHEPGSNLDQELDFFQRHVAELLTDLSSGGEELLSLPWVRKLLDTFLLCQEEFCVILFNNRSILSRPPLDRLISEMYERNVKALDICNAIRDGIERVRQWQKHIEIVLVALDPHHNPISEGHLRRAKKALTDLAILMLDEKDSASVQRNRSFTRNSNLKDNNRGNFRSLSLSVSRSWSAARQLQAIGNNISAPRGHEVVATSGLANPIFAMNSVLHFVMWVLVAAIPCQDRGLHTHFSIPRNFAWGASILSLHDRIMEESKKRERKNSIGLLQEIQQIQKSTRQLLELADSLHFPLAEEEDLRLAVQELTDVYDATNESLEPLERQVREVFHRIVHSRIEAIYCLHKKIKFLSLFCSKREKRGGMK